MSFLTDETNRRTKRLQWSFAAVLTLLVSVAFGTAAATAAEQPKEATAKSKKAKPKTLPRGLSDIPLLFRSREILRTPVVGRKGNVLGQVEELVVDARTGAVRYAALEFSPLFGRDKLFAVPWSGLHLHRGERGLDLRFDVERKQLAKAPGFPRDRWPNIANRKWAEVVDVYYGVVLKQGDLKSDFGTSPRAVSGVPHLMRSSRFHGIKVKDPSGKTIGRIDELIVDLNRAGVRYATVDLKRIKMPDRVLPVPFRSLKFHSADTDEPGKTARPYFVMRLKHVLLGRSPLIDRNNWPELRNPQWSRRIDHYYGVNWKGAKAVKKSKSAKSRKQQ